MATYEDYLRDHLKAEIGVAPVTAVGDPVAESDPTQSQTTLSGAQTGTATLAGGDACDAPLGISDQYVVLDSWLAVRSESDASRGRFKFNVAVAGAASSEAISVRDPLANVIEIQTFQSILPLLSLEPLVTNTVHGAGGLPILTPVSAAGTNQLTDAMSQVPFGNRLVMYIEETSIQSVKGRGGRFTFEYEVLFDRNDPDQTRFKIFPLTGGETYIFTEPLNELNQFTVQFRGPDIPLRFPADTVTEVGARVGAADQRLVLTTATAEDLSGLDGQRVYVEGFQSANAVINQWVNRAEGHLAVNAAASSIELDPLVDTTVLGLGLGAAIPLAGSAVIRIARNRWRIPLRVRSVYPKITNYIVPV